jgi:hypothetical protein
MQATDRTKRSFNFHEERVDSFPFPLSAHIRGLWHMHFNRMKGGGGGSWLAGGRGGGRETDGN